MTDNDLPEHATKPSWNWWKILFFVMLIAFEIAREFAVLYNAEKPMPNTTASLFHVDGYVLAEGSWKRVDGGDDLIPGTVKIECRRETGKCIEASTMIWNKSVFAPDLDWFDAEFSNDAVTYENDRPDCARYSVRMDFKLKKTFAVRERVSNPSNVNCNKLESRIEMQLEDGYDFESRKKAVDQHFVPIIKITRAIFEW